jgi:thioredoxin-like negative regulator of GroEL
MKPVVDRLEQQDKGRVEFRLYDVDTDKTGQDLMQQFGARYVPTFVFVNADGSVSKQLVGETAASAMTAELDKLK